MHIQAIAHGACRYGFDKGDLEAARNMIGKLDGNGQADNFFQQRATAHTNIEYSYLHWHLANSTSLKKLFQYAAGSCQRA